MRRPDITAPRPDIEVVKFTPSMAAEWLARNTHNRSLRESSAKKYAMDMVNGDWAWTGDPIRITSHGEVKDGQHRLRALVIAGEVNPEIVLPFIVVVIDVVAAESIDIGMPRKLHDVLRLRGETNPAALAALVRLVQSWQSGHRRSLSGGGSAGTYSQMLRTLEEHPELREFSKESRRIATHCELPASIVGLLWWVFEGLDDQAGDDARFFFERLADGQGLMAGDAVYELRKTLDTIKASARGERSRVYLIAITIKAWNAYRRGEKVGVLRYRSGGSKPEAFPEPE